MTLDPYTIAHSLRIVEERWQVCRADADGVCYTIVGEFVKRSDAEEYQKYLEKKDQNAKNKTDSIRSTARAA